MQLLNTENDIIKIINEVKAKFLGFFILTLVTGITMNFLFITSINETIKSLRADQDKVNQKIELLTEKFYQSQINKNQLQ